MKRQLFPFLIFAAITACSPQPKEVDLKMPETATPTFEYADILPVKDTLFGAPDEHGNSFAFLNKKGDTIIRTGEFDNCFSTIFTTFAYVADERFKDQGMVAINRNKEVIFEAYIFDNGPDYIVEGLFRIKRNGKIGFADPSGKVVIPAIYSCAYPFENGKAKVALNCEVTSDGEHSSSENDEWFYIDKRGKKIP
jgi:hypothetical protein